MNVTILYYRKSVYGVERVYIQDLEQASLLKLLTGKKSYTVGDMNILRRLGLNVEEVLAPR